MDYLKPSKPFDQLQLPPGGDTACTIVASLSDNQLRYALWVNLVLLFGSPEANASEVVADYDLPSNRAVAEGHLLLAQLGINRTNPGRVRALEQQFANKFPLEG